MITGKNAEYYLLCHYPRSQKAASLMLNSLLCLAGIKPRFFAEVFQMTKEDSSGYAVWSRD